MKESLIFRPLQNRNGASRLDKSLQEHGNMMVDHLSVSEVRKSQPMGLVAAAGRVQQLKCYRIKQRMRMLGKVRYAKISQEFGNRPFVSKLSTSISSALSRLRLFDIRHWAM